MKKATKGEYGYFAKERKSRLILTLLFAAIPVVIFLIGFMMTGTEKNLLSVAALVMVIPFAMSFTGFVTAMTKKSIPEDEYRIILPHTEGLLMAYELYVTHEKASTFIDAAAICGNNVIGLVTDKKGDPVFTREYVEKTLRGAGFSGISVKLMTDVGKFCERLDGMAAHADSLREGLKYKPDARYPDYTREELVWVTLLEISF